MADRDVTTGLVSEDFDMLDHGSLDFVASLELMATDHVNKVARGRTA